MEMAMNRTNREGSDWDTWDWEGQVPVTVACALSRLWCGVSNKAIVLGPLQHTIDWGKQVSFAQPKHGCVR